MIQALKKIFSRGGCEKCGWLVACPECSERMRRVDSDLTKIERARARRKDPRYFSKDQPLKGRFAGLVDKGSFIEVLKQVLVETKGESGEPLMLTVTLAPFGAMVAPADRRQVMQEVAQRIISQVRHQDFVTSFDELTFALLLVACGEEPLNFEVCAKRIEDRLALPLVCSDQQMELCYKIRNILLRPGTTLDHIQQQMDS
ncbi:hypothetical protein [Pelovirga terrestris]|uniref:GGDEF domain-containing protein n=1 Tax=Pelovirga terrestris TaxID=2771352 RepID=A0A8J6QYN9_9BACT|nr:hypothetical protein [Pelovirga terrestris]MBD1401388.1 hypothetical protein [Pelovirga terrestris]